MRHLPLTIVLDGEPQSPHQARLAAELIVRGHRPILLNAPDLAAKVHAEFGHEIHHVFLPGTWPQKLRDRQIRHLLEPLRVDVVHLNNLHPAQLLWQRLGIPYVATAWGPDLLERPPRRPVRHDQQLGQLLRGAAWVTADNQPTLDRARALAGQELPNRLVLWGVELARFDRALWTAERQQWRQRLAIHPDAYVLLSPRPTLESSHPQRILQAFAQMPREPQDTLVFKIHGKDGEAQVQLRLVELAKQLQVQDRVRFAPACTWDELPGLYTLADAAVSALETDGASAIFPELMALEVPIVASALPAYGAMLGGDQALLFGAQSVAEMTHALTRMRETPRLRAHMANEARKWAIAQADWHHSVTAWLELYGRALDGQERRH